MPKIESKPTKEKDSGWGAVAKRKSEASAMSSTSVYDLIIKDGESVIIQFLEDAPYCFDAHQVKDRHGKWRTLTCQLMTQDHCVLCDADVKQAWKAAFKVLDYRGEWDKEKKRNKGGKPVEKLWKCSNTVALQIEALINKKGVPLTKQVFEITRTGSGAKDTSYNFQLAFDEETETRMKPIPWDSETESSKKLCRPLPDVVLEKMGFGEAEDDD